MPHTAAFHDGKTPAGASAWAAVAATSSDRAGSAAAVESRTRRLMPDAVIFPLSTDWGFNHCRL
jgi:hypothetical protein